MSTSITVGYLYARILIIFLRFIFLRSIYIVWVDPKQVKSLKMKNEKSDNVDIITDIKIKSKRKILNVTTQKWIRHCPNCNIDIFHTRQEDRNRWHAQKILCVTCASVSRSRACPSCNAVLFYKTTHKFKKATVNNSVCKSCNGKKKRKFISSHDLVRSCSECHTDIHHVSYKSYINSIRLNRLCRSCATKKAGNTTIEKQNRRERRLNKHTPAFNVAACSYFDQLSIDKQWNLQHALNGGEIKCIGYSLDAYDAKNNIVVEYDERHHYSKNQLKEKDVTRQNEIICHLKCRFFRYNEFLNLLYEITPIHNLN